MTHDEVMALSPDEVRVKVAERRGWKREIRRSYRETPGWFHPNGVSLFDDPPDYTRDLNAMHEAEKALTPSQCHVYERALARMFDDALFADGAPSWMWYATAEQRARAFLMV